MALKPVEAVLLRAVLNVGKFKELAMFNDPEFDKQRKESTLQLLQILGQLILEHPEQRFGQILQNYGFVSHYDENDPYAWNNEFYMEPVALLKRVQAKLNAIKNPKG